jgi:hypothetical protein
LIASYSYLVFSYSLISPLSYTNIKQTNYRRWSEVLKKERKKHEAIETAQEYDEEIHSEVIKLEDG